MDNPFTVEKLDHIVLRVRDVDRAVAFYEMFGGRPEGVSGARNTPLALGPISRVLLLHDPDYDPRASGQNLQHFALQLETTHDIDDVVAFVRAHGAEPWDGPKDNGRGSVQFRVNDPDGNEIELRIAQIGR